MNIWIFAWVVFAVFILGIFFWSVQILFQQKRAWKRLSNSLNWNYREQALLKSPIVEGVYNGFSVLIYSEEQPVQDMGRRQYRTVLLIGFQEGFPMGAALASDGRRAFIESLKIEEVHKPDFEGWNGSVIFHTEDDKVCAKFMNKNRYEALHKLMNLKKKDSVFICDDKEGYYRVETPDPLTDEAVIKKMLDKFTEACEALRPTEKDKPLFPKKPKTEKKQKDS